MTYAVQMPEFDESHYASVFNWLLEEGEPIVPGVPIVEVYTWGAVETIFAKCYGTVSWIAKVGALIKSGSAVAHIEAHKDDSSKKSGLIPRRSYALWAKMKGIQPLKKIYA